MIGKAIATKRPTKSGVDLHRMSELISVSF